VHLALNFCKVISGQEILPDFSLKEKIVENSFFQAKSGCY
jgi:hypothetical protein